MRPISSGGLGQPDVALPATTITDVVLAGRPPPAKQAVGVAGEETRSGQHSTQLTSWQFFNTGVTLKSTYHLLS
ncbi:MAG: hypothetical protein ACM3MK_00260 [Chitinophagales bacterium]